MTDGPLDFALGPHDAAIVIRADGECEVYLPTHEDDTLIEKHEPTAEITKLAIAHSDPEIRALLETKLYGT